MARSQRVAPVGASRTFSDATSPGMVCTWPPGTGGGAINKKINKKQASTIEYAYSPLYSSGAPRWWPPRFSDRQRLTLQRNCNTIDCPQRRDERWSSKALPSSIYPFDPAKGHQWPHSWDRDREPRSDLSWTPVHQRRNDQIRMSGHWLKLTADAAINGRRIGSCDCAYRYYNLRHCTWSYF